MDTFIWDRNFETGLRQVDEQHRVLVDLINRFSSMVGGGPVDPKLAKRTCDELVEYARYHFAEEQMFMDELGVDRRHVALHSREHAEFFLDLARMQAELQSGLPEAPRHLLEFMIHWLAAHILGSDQAMARQIAAMSAGRTPAEAFALEERGQTGATGVLLRSLNGLLAVLGQRSRQLSELNYTLENRAFRRTQELSLANERLAQSVKRLEAQQLEARRLGAELAEANRSLEALAMVDRLTGLPNLAYATGRLTAEIAAARQFGHALSVALFAAEGFKEANEAFGHRAGDQIIQSVGGIVRLAFRSHDVVCHVGVEEFLVICPCTTHADAVRLTAKVQAALPGLVVPLEGGEWRGRLSVGIAEFGPQADSVKQLLLAASRRRWPLEALTQPGAAAGAQGEGRTPASS